MACQPSSVAGDSAGLEAAAGRSVGLTFVPHLVPMIQAYTQLCMHASRQSRFQGCMRIAPRGPSSTCSLASEPDTRPVRHEYLPYTIHRPQGDMLVVISIDNLAKEALQDKRCRI
jgi:N-acetyl-gamma-glutamyl-phosphate reductase